jgi:hypothetical protein
MDYWTTKLRNQYRMNLTVRNSKPTEQDGQETTGQMSSLGMIIEELQCGTAMARSPQHNGILLYFKDLDIDWAHPN